MMDPVDELKEMDTEEPYVISRAERKFIGQSYDLSIQTLFEQWNAGLLVLPDYQREYIWDAPKASRLIESLILNIPIPPIYIAELPNGLYEIVDGHQRVRSIVNYLGNELKLSGLWVLTEYQGLNFDELPPREQRILKMRIMRSVIISVDSHPNMKFEIFERLNTGAIMLNAQELRNALYRGTFNEMLRQLIHQDLFREIIGTKSPRKRMVDEEMILRFFALNRDYEIYKAPLKRFLNEYMQSVKDEDADVLGEKESFFNRTISLVYKILGKSAFRPTNLRGQPTEPSVNRALYDAQMLTFSWLDDSQNIKKHVSSARRELALLYRKNKKNREFLEAIGRATNDRSRLRCRVRETARALQKAGYKLRIPFDLD